MADIVITKRDIIWSYIAKFFNISTGLITLPLILHMLSPEEIGMNYLMVTVSTMVALLDFGFAPQFGRNFTYVNSGARRLLKEGVEYNNGREVDYHLLSVLLKTAQMVYRRLSLVCVFIMLTGGSAYIYYVTNGFSTVDNSLAIWILFSISNYFNIYYTYYSSLLTGSGKVAEQNISIILSRIANIAICVGLLLLHMGLFAIVIANFISPFVQRSYSYRVFFTNEIRSKIDVVITKTEINNVFNIIWYNAKKLGINFLGAYAINKSAMFIIGFYLPLSVVGSYGLLIQVTNILLGVAQTFFVSFQPKFANYRVTNQLDEFKKLIGITFGIYFIIMICGSLFVVVWGNPVLEMIGSKTLMPGVMIQFLYLLTITLEGNHSMFATLIVTDNKVPFVKAALLSGTVIILLTVLFMHFTSLSLLGVVLAQFVVQISYNNWKWPLWIFKDLHTNPLELIYNFHNGMVKAVFKK